MIRQIKKEAMASFRIGMVALPSHISKEIAQVAKQTPKREVSDGLHRINAFLTAGGSEKLKQKAAERGLVAISDDESVPSYSEQSEAVAYTCARMVSSYASIYNVFSHISKKVPLFNVKSLLDFGAGPATGYLAFKSIWPQNNLEKYIAIDKSNQMLQIGKQLAGASLTKDCPDQEQGTVFLFENFLQPQMHKADLVICAFTLSELQDHVNAKDLIRTLWASTVDTLVIIDRGTPIGFELVANARTQILKEESLSSNDIVHIVAPCPHEKECPVLQNQNKKTHSYCSFSQRIQLDATAVSASPFYSLYPRYVLLTLTFSFLAFPEALKEQEREH